MQEILNAIGQGREGALFRRFHHLDRVPVETQRTAADLVIEAVTGLAQRTPLAGIDLILIAHSGFCCDAPDAPPLAALLERFDFVETDAFGVAHANCTSSFYALQLGLDLIAHSIKQRVLIVAADCLGLFHEARHLPGSSLIGDAAAAYVLSEAEQGVIVRSVRNVADTRFFAGAYLQDAQLVSEFNTAGLDRMHAVMEGALVAAGRGWSDVALILPHNVNETVWRRFATQYGFPRERIFLDNVRRLGHTCCSDALLNLHDILEASDCEQSNPLARSCGVLLLVGVGLGAYYSAAVVELPAQGAGT